MADPDPAASASASANDVELVRCPKCKNLLPELPHYSLYQCGGCGAVLKAKRSNTDPDKSAQEIVGAVYPKSNNSSDKGISNGPDSSESDSKGIADITEACDMDVKSIGSSSVVEFKDVVGDHDAVTALPLERLPKSNEVPDSPQLESNLYTKIDRGGMSVIDESEPHPRNTNGFMRLVPNQRSSRSNMEGNEKTCKNWSDVVKLTSSKCVVEGPSNLLYDTDCTSHLDPGMRNRYLDVSKRVDHLEQDRLVLLRKLQDLNLQLSRSGDLAGTPKEKAGLDRGSADDELYDSAAAWKSDDRPDLRKASKQTFEADKNNCRPLYYTSCPDSHPYAYRHGLCTQSSYNHMHIQNDTLRYGVGTEFHKPRGPATTVSSQYFHHPSFPLYHPGQFIEADPDIFKPYQHNASLHHPSCSCFHCYNTNRNVIQPVPQSYSFIPGAYDSRVTSVRDPKPHTSMAIDFNPPVDSYERSRPGRVVLSKGRRIYHPVLGGAPFMTCHYCLELLQLPIKLLKLENRQQKVRCGACSTLICYFFQDKKLLVSDHVELKNDGDSSEEMVGGISKSLVSTDRTEIKFYSDDFDSSSYDFKLFDKEPVLPANLVPSSSMSPSRSEEECSQLNLEAQRKLQSCVYFPENSNPTLSTPGSPLQEHFDYSSKNHIANRRPGKGNQSSRSDEKVCPKVVTSRQNSLKEASMATEMDVSFNECSNLGWSQDSGDGGKEDHHPQIDRKDGSSENIKKIFRDFSKHYEGVEGDKNFVTINGHVISDRMIKKAEKRAGRVQPGNYWYDIRAGFWGVMGGPCLGIIPPFIEEFNYPLSEKCSGGTTGVFVNGRELHEKDLELLSSRGLPTTRHKSYIIEISGRVLDEGSGKELKCLGRLAPTVEKAKHGFGMKVPKQIVVNKIEQE
uniref:Zinc-ribbon domain-containing protein n=2 Tax=Kalanchoe fedtschenkoi TaxID=63787 RepID=A0A7N1A3V9_KALFE